jgi:hypothetical protein
MQAVEIAVFICITIIVGSLITAFLVDWDAKETYNEMNDIIYPKDESAYKKTDKEGFVIELYTIWKDCGYGELNRSVPIYVEKDREVGDESLTKEYIFTQLKKLNWCQSLQSKEYNCGEGEDLIIGDNIALPALIAVTCKEGDLLIS